MFIFALYVRTNGKQNYAGYVFVATQRYRLPKRKNTDKRILKRKHTIYWFKPKLLSCQPVRKTFRDNL